MGAAETDKPPSTRWGTAVNLSPWVWRLHLQGAPRVRKCGSKYTSVHPSPSCNVLSTVIAALLTGMAFRGSRVQISPTRKHLSELLVQRAHRTLASMGPLIAANMPLRFKPRSVCSIPDTLSRFRTNHAGWSRSSALGHLTGLSRSEGHRPLARSLLSTQANDIDRCVNGSPVGRPAAREYR